ncbi:MAG: hypothetical protein KDA65_04030 [Planctomycetaceae bacterium]|nr:hypothetical protein [Planctomycetaceae bacterium]
MNVRNAIFVLVALTPLFCLRFAGTIHHYVADGGQFDLLTYLEEYGDRDQAPDSWIASNTDDGIRIAEAVMDLGVQDEFFENWLEQLEPEEPSLSEACADFTAATGIDLQRWWDRHVVGMDGWQFLRNMSGRQHRAPALAERPVESPFLFSSYQVQKPELTRERQIEQVAEREIQKAFPDDITPGHYRVVDNLGLVTEVVITDEELNVFQAPKNEVADHYVLHQGDRAIYFIRLKSPVTARQNGYLQMLDQWISRINREHVDPSVRTMMSYAFPMEKAESSLRQISNQAVEVYQQIGESFAKPTRLTTSPEAGQLR